MKKLLPLVILLVTTAAIAQSEIKSGDWVVPKFPKKLVTFDKIKVWSARSQYRVILTKSATGVAVNSVNDWEASDYPLMFDFKVKEFERSKNKPGRILLVATNFQIEITVPAEIDLQTAAAAVLFKGTLSQFVVSDYFLAQQKLILPKIFRGPSSSLPYDTQAEIMKWVSYKSDALSAATFKEKSYLALKLDSDVVYNTIQVNQAERASRQTEIALVKLKEMFSIVGKAPMFDGVKIVAPIYSRDFVNERYKNPHEELFEIYVPFDLLKKFVESDITNQELTEGSIILIDGSRVKVNLSGF